MKNEEWRKNPVSGSGDGVLCIVHLGGEKRKKNILQKY